MMLTALMMSAEIAAGLAFGSIALFADGLHMAGHVAVLGAAAYAYSFARRHAGAEPLQLRHRKGWRSRRPSQAQFCSDRSRSACSTNPRIDSSHHRRSRFAKRWWWPALGFSVNLLCARLLWHGDHGHEHGDHEHAHHHADHNLQAAYLHLVTDVLTSALVIVALLSGQFLGWVWMDPVMGIVGALVILNWSWGLLRRTGKVLLDATPAVADDVRRAVESDADNRIADLHVWRVGPGHLAAILTVVTREPRPPAHYKSLLAVHSRAQPRHGGGPDAGAVSGVEHERELAEHRLHAARHA